MHGVAAARHAVEAHRRVELRQFRLELLVDPQQGLEGAANVAIATRYDLIDGGFACVGNHGYFSVYAEQFVVSAPIPVDVECRRPATPQSDTCTHGESGSGIVQICR